MTNNNSSSDSSSDTPHGSPEDPDLSFASDSQMPFGPSGRDAFTPSGTEEDASKTEGSQWNPNAVPSSAAANDKPELPPAVADPDDTWVPTEGSVGGGQDESSSVGAEEGLDPNLTWVLPGSAADDAGSGAEEDQPVSAAGGDEELDPNKTWTPSNTPTADGLASSDDDDLIDPDRTWMPSSTPTTDGLAANEERGGEPVDPNKTWTPSSSPTAHGIPDEDESFTDDADPFEKTWDASSSQASGNSSDEDPPEPDSNKTWVPSSSPTADGVYEAADAGDDAALDADSTWVLSERPEPPEGMVTDARQLDEDRTWVPSTTPTTTGADKSQMPVDLTETVDLRDGAPPSVPEAGVGADGFEDTVQLPANYRPQMSAEDTETKDQATADGGDVFQKTIGMRRPLDTDDLPPAAMMDSPPGQSIHLDLPTDETGQLNTNATQLWARQSGADLNQSLTIRSSPVAGDSHFETAKVSSKQPDYQIVEKIGEGGMGAIFLATQTSLDRQLAIKTLKVSPGGARRTSGSGRHSSSADRQRRDMFLAEALITANLVHPHIIPIHDLCETAEGLPFYSMKRVVGTPWCDRLRKMEVDENLDVLLKVCDAIAYAHHNGVVNRDLKPENVMLGEFGEVLVLDWGLAVPSSAADKKKFNSPSAPFGAGTPAYMAPELWTGPEEIIGYWSDIYLLGAILFEIITGKTPHKFSEPSAKAGNTGLWMVIDKVVRRNDIRQTEHKGELMDIALKAMETRPKDRFESVLKFQEALKNFQAHEESRRLSSRASETLKSAENSKVDLGYLGYQSASALFEEAKAAWTENHEATEGLRHTRLQYAGLAHDKGDYDLGLQIAALEDGPAFIEIRKKLLRSRRLRSALKSAVVVASAIIVAVGIFSFIQSREIKTQNRQIIALNGTRESLQSDIKSARNEIVEAEQKRKLADLKATDAEARAIAAADKAEDARLKVAEAGMLLAESKQKLETADARLDDASIKLATANTTLQETEKKVADLEIKKSRSAVDLKNAEIAGLIRNGNYSGALTEVEELLSDLAESDEMKALPGNERQQREVELQARRRQLLQRAVQVKVPVQSQVVSPTGRYIVWADQNGKIEVRTLSGAGAVSDKVIAQTQLAKSPTTVVMSDSERLVVVADGSTIKVWDFQAGKTVQLLGHQGGVTKIRTVGEFLISADETGSIRAWSLTSSKQLWSIRSSSRIVDLALLPNDLIFVYAGSRGGESADIIAYQLAGLVDSSERPTRLGQLKFPRDRIDPPRALAVSPDGQRLLISNSRNGSVLVLPRRTLGSEAGRDKFPFQHVTDLAEDRPLETWVANRHQRPVNQIHVSTDGKRFCTASDDRTIGVWQFSAAGTPQLLERLEGHGARVNAAAFTDELGQQVVSVAADDYCRFWNVKNYQADKRKLEQEFQLSSSGLKDLWNEGLAQRAVESQSLFRWGRWYATSLLLKPSLGTAFSFLSQDVQVVADASFKDGQTFNVGPVVQRGALKSVVVSADGRLLTTGGSDGTAVIWDTTTGRPLKAVSATALDQSSEPAFDEGHDFNVSRFRFLPPDGKHLLTTGFDGNLCIWNADTNRTGTGHQTLRMPGLGLVNAIATSSNGEFVIMSALSDDQTPGLCRVYRVADLLKAEAPTPICEFSGFHTSEISAISIDADGTRAVTGGRDGRVALWSCVDGQILAAGRIHSKNTIVSYLKLFGDGRILSTGYDGRMLLLQADVAANGNSRSQTFNVIRRYQHDRIPVERVAVHPDENTFVTISIRTERKTKTVNYELSLWYVHQPTSVRRLAPAIVEGRAPVRVSAIDFSPDGSQLAAVVDQRIQVIDSNTWKVMRVVGSASGGISDVMFSPEIDGEESKQRIATFDGVAAQLWDLKSGAQLAAFRPLFSVASLAKSTHQRQLLLTGDRSIRVFQSSADDKGFGRCIFKIEDPHAGIVNSIAFHPVRTNVFVSSGTDGCVCFWRWRQDQVLAELICRVPCLGDRSAGVDLCWTANGENLWVADQLGGLRMLDQDGNTVLDSVVLDGLEVELSDLAVQGDGRFIAVCGKETSGSLSAAWIFEKISDDTSDEDRLVVHCRLNGHDAGGIRAIQFVPNSPYVVTAGADGACLVWNWMPERSAERPVEAYEAFQFMTLNGRVAHEAPVNAISVTDQGDVATVSDDGTARLWRNPFLEVAADAATVSGSPGR